MEPREKIDRWRRLSRRALELEQWGAEALFRLNADRAEKELQINEKKTASPDKN